MSLPCSNDIPQDIRLADIPTHEGRMEEMQRRYDEFIAAEDQC